MRQQHTSIRWRDISHSSYPIQIIFWDWSFLGNVSELQNILDDWAVSIKTRCPWNVHSLRSCTNFFRRYMCWGIRKLNNVQVWSMVIISSIRRYFARIFSRIRSSCLCDPQGSIRFYDKKQQYWVIAYWKGRSSYKGSDIDYCYTAHLYWFDGWLLHLLASLHGTSLLQMVRLDLR